MKHVYLTSEEYEKVLKFQNEIHPESEDYHSNVIRLFKELFGWNLTVYSRWSRNDQLYSVKTSGLREDFVRECHNRLFNDEIYQIYTCHIRSNQWDGTFFSQDIEYLNKNKTQLSIFLQAHNISHFAAMLIGEFPNEHYNIYKTGSEGPFTEHEKEIIRHIQRYLSACVRIHRSLSLSSNAMLLVNRHFVTEGQGCVLIDEYGDVINYNEIIFRMVPKNERLTQITYVVQYILDTVEQKTGMTLEDISGKVSTAFGGYLVTIEELSIVTVDHEKTTFYLILASPSYYRNMTFDYESSRKYSLTERELQIAELIVKGTPNKLIADQLHLSMSTVKIHNSNIFRKLQVHNRMGVVEKLTKIN